MHIHRDNAAGRLRRLVDERVTPALHRRTVALRVTAWRAPGEPVPFAEAQAADYHPVAPGTPWGAPWSTWWFHVTGEWPDDLRPDPAVGCARMDVLVDLGFRAGSPGFQCEGTAWSPDGRILKGISPFNHHVPATDVSTGNRIDFYVEAAANPDTNPDFDFAPTPLGDRDTAGEEPLYVLGEVVLAERDLEVEELAHDLRVLRGLLDVLPPSSPRAARIGEALQRCADAVDPADVAGTAAAGRAELAQVLAAPAVASAHRVVAVGHAHIDSAWLWPARETVRKCARTFANALSLLAERPEMIFVASSAQQYEWVRAHYPELFERIRVAVADGRWLPVGGMWVESDTNLPGGEALVRQFTEGTRWFQEAFGVESAEVWLPDSFGYSAGLPQIARQAGKRWLLTQKMSWNDTNRLPHSTFWWEGLDGSRLLAHLPPVDTYNSSLSAAELAHAETSFAEHAIATTSLVPYGYGDGGGGPTREMAATAERVRDLEGSPRLEHACVAEFFTEAEGQLRDAERPGRPAPAWSGEMYLEFHRGTYTSQARTKFGNRRCEHLFREAELWAATAALRGVADWPARTLRDCWRALLMTQFHDVLPGSSISWVHRDAERTHTEVAARLEEIVERSLRALAGPGDRNLVANAGPFGQDGVEALGVAPAVPPAGPRVEVGPSGAVLTAPLVVARLDAQGRLVSLCGADGREAVAPDRLANTLELFRDLPNRWDAWDLDAHHHRTPVAVPVAAEMTGAEVDGIPAVRVERRLSDVSSVVQHVLIRPGTSTVEFRTAVRWHETARVLKLGFGLDLRAERSAAETQFGHVTRPIGDNTSWEAAQFEICAHRFLHVGEPGYGVVIANDGVYGHDVTRHVRDDGGTTTQVRVSLLRSPTYPDPHADGGSHERVITVTPQAGLAEAVAEGYRVNLPPRRFTGARDVEPPVRVTGDGVVVEAVLLAHDGSGDLVVRVYEALGNRVEAVIRASDMVRGWRRTDLLERGLADWEDGGEARLSLRPFELCTVRFRSAGAAPA